jgi:hypothetical protein
MEEKKSNSKNTTEKDPEETKEESFKWGEFVLNLIGDFVKNFTTEIIENVKSQIKKGIYQAKIGASVGIFIIISLIFLLIGIAVFLNDLINIAGIGYILVGFSCLIIGYVIKVAGESKEPE